jgi:hypothetical protein
MDQSFKKVSKITLLLSVFCFLATLSIMTVFLYPTKIYNTLIHKDYFDGYTDNTIGIDCFVRFAPIYTKHRNNENSILLFPINLGKNDQYDALGGFNSSQDVFSLKHWLIVDFFPSIILALICAIISIELMKIRINLKKINYGKPRN